MTHAHHKGDNPPAQSNFHPHIAKQEDSARPGNAGRRTLEERMSEATFRIVRRPDRRTAKDGGISFPETGRTDGQFDRRASNLFVSFTPVLYSRDAP